MKINIPSELYTTFNSVTYFDESHKYYLNGCELISVTTILHQYLNQFNEEYWAGVKGVEFNLSSKLIKRAWKFINEKGTFKGSIIHDYSENLFLNKVFKYPQIEILRRFGFDPILKEYNITKQHVDNFHTDVQGKLIPIRTEFVIYDEESLIGGMLDMLFYNIKAGEFQIWDWKTNKELTLEGKHDKLTGCLYMLDECDLEIYSLQLSMYKLIIEKNTGLKLGDSYLVWFSHNNSSYKIIKTKNRSYYANQILNERISNIKKTT